MEQEYSSSKGTAEHILDLGDGRQLSFAHSGPTASRTLVLSFTGLFSVGSVPQIPKPCQDAGVHWIHPTLPGLGRSSPRSPGDNYHVALARDMTALIDHLYPSGDFDRIYVSGGSYGSVQAQMLYGAPYDIFPAGRKLTGCVLLAGFAPFKYHVNYAKDLSWHTWFSVGPPSQLIPFHILQRLLSTLVASQFKTRDGARKFLNQSLYSKMGADERKVFEEFLEKRGITEEAFIGNQADGAVRCCAQWYGFIETSDIIHSDWGFEPAKLDEEHASKPMLIVGSSGDPQGGHTNGWLGANYRSSRVKTVPGGHISSMFYMDKIWEEMFAMSQQSGV